MEVLTDGLAWPAIHDASQSALPSPILPFQQKHHFIASNGQPSRHLASPASLSQSQPVDNQLWLSLLGYTWELVSEHTVSQAFAAYRSEHTLSSFLDSCNLRQGRPSQQSQPRFSADTLTSWQRSSM